MVSSYQPRGLNVFKGPDAIKDYFNPDFNPPLPLIEIPAKLNPLRSDGVRIFAKMMTALPAQNVKMLPALNMIHDRPEVASKSIVEASSGSTVLSLSMLSHILWDKNDVCAYVTNKKHPDSLKLLRFFGLKVGLYGGLAQQDPDDPRGIMARLRKRDANEDGTCYLGQYDNDCNWKSHVRWTGPQIWDQLPEVNIFCTTVGTGGAITGTGVYLKAQKPSLKVIGVCNAFGDPTPGPRHFPGFESCKFPWKTTIDSFQTVASVDAYRTSMSLCRNGIIVGPSSGEALFGLLDYLQTEKDLGRLNDLADPRTGEINCVFMCCDLPYQYIDGYYQKLDEDVDFPPIINKELLGFDTNQYDERWELQPGQVIELLSKDHINKESACAVGEGTEYFDRVHGDPAPTSACPSVSSPFKMTIPTAPSSPSSSSLLSLSASPYASSRSSLSSIHSAPRHDRDENCVTVVDLRQQADFDEWHHPTALNSPLQTLTAETGDIYGDDSLLKETWLALSTKFDTDDILMQDLKSRSSVVMMCYDGESSRMATSILRAKGIESFSVFGGVRSLRRYIYNDDP